jgi:hypothetical protein
MGRQMVRARASRFQRVQHRRPSTSTLPLWAAADDFKQHSTVFDLLQLAQRAWEGGEGPASNSVHPERVPRRPRSPYCGEAVASTRCIALTDAITASACGRRRSDRACSAGCFDAPILTRSFRQSGAMVPPQIDPSRAARPVDRLSRSGTTNTLAPPDRRRRIPPLRRGRRGGRRIDDFGHVLHHAPPGFYLHRATSDIWRRRCRPPDRSRSVNYACRYEASRAGDFRPPEVGTPSRALLLQLAAEPIPPNRRA